MHLISCLRFVNPMKPSSKSSHTHSACHSNPIPESGKMFSRFFSYFFSSESTRMVELSSSAKFTWKIENWSRLNDQQGTCSDVFTFGGFKWKVCMNEEKKTGLLSLFLIAVDMTELPHVEYRFTIISQTDRKNKVRDELKCEFSGGSNYYRGWQSSIRLSDLEHPAKGYIVDDSCVIRLDISCRMMEEPAIHAS